MTTIRICEVGAKGVMEPDLPEAKPGSAAPVVPAWRPNLSAVLARIRSWEPQRRVLTAVLAAVCGVVVVCLRRPSAITDPGLYGEDGVIFLPDSLQMGASAIFSPYNGYLHLIPRLVAGLASVLPLAWTPLVFTLCTAVITVICCAIVLSRRFAELLPSYADRLVLFILLLVIPRLIEVHLSLNSALWFCGVALMLTALAGDPASLQGKLVEGAAVPVLVLSGLAGVVLAPLAILRCVRTRSVQSVVVLVVWWAAASAQLIVYALEDRRNGVPSEALPLARVAIEKVFGSLLFGGGLVDGRWLTGMPRALVLLLLPVAVLWVAVVVSGLRWVYSAALLWAVAASLASGFMALGSLAVVLPDGFAVLPDRYTVVPIAAVLIGLMCSRPPRRALETMRVGFLLVVVVLRFTDFTVPARPSTHWGESMDCLEVPQRECVVELNPENWTVTIPPGVR